MKSLVLRQIVLVFKESGNMYKLVMTLNVYNFSATILKFSVSSDTKYVF